LPDWQLQPPSLQLLLQLIHELLLLWGVCAEAAELREHLAGSEELLAGTAAQQRLQLVT
jgi:hypothetical protein